MSDWPWSDQERLAIVLQRHVRYDNGFCWIWTGAKSQGYGKLVIDGKHIRAHRWLYEQMREPIQGILHHECRNQTCVNPWHLRDLTRALHKKEHKVSRCKRGHLLDTANTYIRPNGGRTCRECKRTRARELYALKAAA